MINKVTVEKAWRTNPKKIYYVIQNPRIDKENKKILGLTIKEVEYRVRNWDKKFIYFERINTEKDKRFPEVLTFDKRYPDAEDEVLSERVSKANKKPDYVDSYAVFGDKKIAHYNKLARLHRLAKELLDIYNILKGETTKKGCGSCSTGCGGNCSTSEENDDKHCSCNSEGKCDASCNDIEDNKAVKDAMKETDKNNIDLSLEEIKGYFEDIQNTDYFDELEKIQAENPNIASM